MTQPTKPESQKAYEEWYGEVAKRGDPQRMPNLTQKAFAAGWLACVNAYREKLNAEKN
jgi:hypothetical protein